jgi:hypothetical protein
MRRDVLLDRKIGSVVSTEGMPIDDRNVVVKTD